MASVSELIDSRNFTRDKNGAEAGSRTFRVLQAGNELGAINAVYADADAQRFPGAPSLNLDRVDVQGSAGNTLWICKASYSSFNGFVRLDTSGQGNRTRSWGWDYKVSIVETPYITRDKKLIENIDPNNPDPVAINYWSTKIVKVSETRITRSYFTTQTVQNVREFDIIAKQHNKLHYINGQWILFRGGQVAKDSAVAGQYQVTYFWEQDSGTTIKCGENSHIYLSGFARPANCVQIPQSDDLAFILGIDYTEPNDKYITEGEVMIRPPYYRLDVVVSNNQTTQNEDFPRAVGIPEAAVDAEGWRLLPGFDPT